MARDDVELGESVRRFFGLRSAPTGSSGGPVDAFDRHCQSLADLSGASIEIAREVEADRAGFTSVESARASFNADDAASRAGFESVEAAREAIAEAARKPPAPPSRPARPAPPPPAPPSPASNSSALTKLVEKYEQQGHPFVKALEMAEAEMNPERAARLAAARREEHR